MLVVKVLSCVKCCLAERDELSVAGRSWRHLSGQQLDCITCTTPDAPVGSLEEAAPVSALTATSVGGGVSPASAVAQGHAAKHDLGEVGGDAAMGGVMSPLPSRALLTHNMCCMYVYVYVYVSYVQRFVSKVR